MEKLALGTKETLVISVVDRLNNLNTLDGLVLKFDVIDRANNKQINQLVATNSGMKVLCLVDTTVGTWTPGRYQLFVDITVGTEKPRLGPFDFEVA